MGSVVAPVRQGQRNRLSRWLELLEPFDSPASLRAYPEVTGWFPVENTLDRTGQDRTLWILFERAHCPLKRFATASLLLHRAPGMRFQMVVQVTSTSEPQSTSREETREPINNIGRM